MNPGTWVKISLGWDDNRPIYFMNDRQKGGLSALGKEWPKARSIEVSWARFGRCCQLVDSEPVEKWARYAFNARIKSDHITNNMFDCFNGWIKDERDKPILTLLELLKRKIMVRFCEKWEELKKWNDSITLYARE
ncbi:hypothetical protein ACOSQ4_015002 [Xanthoceras sorbifolium]